LRRQRGRSAHLTTAAYQMVFGGLGQCVVGLALGEVGQLRDEPLSVAGVGAFFYLLVFGSLIGFISYTWLLGHVSVTQAGTYAYVTPVLAILVGGLLGNETITGWIVGGMACILGGVALLRTGGIRLQGKGHQEQETGKREAARWSWVRRP
jgi:drug/metabolite transporter (DMT)-like permease